MKSLLMTSELSSVVGNEGPFLGENLFMSPEKLYGHGRKTKVRIVNG